MSRATVVLLCIAIVVAMHNMFPTHAVDMEAEAQRREFAAYLAGLTDGAREGYLRRTCGMRDVFALPAAR